MEMFTPRLKTFLQNVLLLGTVLARRPDEIIMYASIW